MYYEVHGKGKPLVLLHGALSTIGTSFSATAPRLATTRMVIAVEQQGHGRTADAARPLSVPGMGAIASRPGLAAGCRGMAPAISVCAAVSLPGAGGTGRPVGGGWLGEVQVWQIADGQRRQVGPKLVRGDGSGQHDARPRPGQGGG